MGRSQDRRPRSSYSAPHKHLAVGARHAEALAGEGAMLNEPELLWLIDRIYEGAVTSYGWVGLLRELAEAFRSDTGTIAIHSLPAGVLRASAFVGIEPGYQSSYGALAARPD